jgi:tricorn protease
MRYIAFIFALAALLGSDWAAADIPHPLFRYPALSRDGNLVAFGYGGDIWLVRSDGKELRRLTDHVAYDSRPVFSPVADLLAFSSDREGAADVYVIPLEGGEPRRLTWHSADEAVLGFSPDGQEVLFRSSRDTLRSRLYAVSLEGREPRMVLDVPAVDGAWSSDGQSFAFVMGAMSSFRRNYRGSANFDIWIRRFSGPKAVKITFWEGNDEVARFGPDGYIYFISDRDGTGNLWRMKPENPEKAEQLTVHRRHPVRSISVSASGRFVVYTNIEGGLYIHETATGKTRPLPLGVVSDTKENPMFRKTFTDGAADLAVSPDGTDLAFVVRGDIFVVARKGGKARQVTRGPARERHPAWTPDGKSLLFVSDRKGSNDIYMVTSDEKGDDRLSRARFFRTKVLVASDLNEEHPTVAPDGKHFLYLAGLGHLYVAPIEGNSARLVCLGPRVEDPCWSPDSRWIAFSRTQKDWNAEIYVIPATGGKQVNLTCDPDDDMQPAFGPKGEYLYFASSRGGGGERFNIYRIPLTLAVDQRYKEDLEREEEEKEKDEDEEDGKEKEKKKKKKSHKNGKEDVPEVKIDFLKIEDRARQVTSTRGNDTLPVASSDGKTLYFKSTSLGYAEIWKTKTDGGSLHRLTRSKENPSEMVWSQKKKELVYRAGGSIRTLSADGKAGRVGFRAKMAIDLGAERMEAFTEAWRLLRDYFYDPKMHGVSWKRCREEYGRLALDAKCTTDFNTVVRMMIGELGASHLGIWGPGSGRSPEKTGFTGLIWRPGPKGLRYIATRALPKSPADREDSRVKAGEFLVAVNRKVVRVGDNLARLFNGTVGEKVDLRIAAAEEGGKERTVTLKPVDPGRVRSLLYEAWVEENRRKVESVSSARLGYIHIRAMSGRSFRRFRRDYLARVRERDALVLDVRNNPGGYIHNQLWELLSKRQAVGYFRIRGTGEEFQPDHTWRKPVVLLINERSASDAEIFPHGFRRLGIGKVVGVPTWGGVIGTGGTRLINGAWFRLPYVGWYTEKGVNLENLGVKPDIHVENHPEDVARGQDDQLDRAVAVVLAELRKKKK